VMHLAPGRGVAPRTVMCRGVAERKTVVHRGVAASKAVIRLGMAARKTAVHRALGRRASRFTRGAPVAGRGASPFYVIATVSDQDMV
jgi:hypothetical protein